MKTVITFRATGMSDQDFIGNVNEAQATADAETAIARHDGDAGVAAANFLTEFPNYAADFTSFPKTDDSGWVVANGKSVKVI